MSQRIWRTHVPYLVAIATLLMAWQIAALYLPDFLLPGLPETAMRATRLFQGPLFREGLQRSFLRLGIGYTLACAMGITMGLAGGLIRPLALYLRGLITVLQSVPPITWIPFLLILIGFGDTPVIIVVTLAAFFPMALAVLNGTEGINRTYIELAQVMGASRGQLLRKVYAPATLPAVITGAQVAFGNAWRSLIAGEMVAGVGSGLGWSISFSGEVADMAGVLVGIAIVGISAAVCDALILERMKRYLLRWQNEAGGQP